MKDWDDEVFISPFGIIRELKSMGNKYGEDVLKDLLIYYAETNNIEANLPDNLMEELNSTDGDNKMIKPILQNINDFILKNPSEKSETPTKYKWLRQFMTWTQTPKNHK